MTEPHLSREIGLIRRMAAGEGEALAEIYDLHAPMALGLLVHLLGRRSEAEEVLQEVFLQAWTEADRYDPKTATPRGWLLMIARSRALDRVRCRH